MHKVKTVICPCPQGSTRTPLQQQKSIILLLSLPGWHRFSCSCNTGNITVARKDTKQSSKKVSPPGSTAAAHQPLGPPQLPALPSKPLLLINSWWHPFCAESTHARPLAPTGSEAEHPKNVPFSQVAFSSDCSSTFWILAVSQTSGGNQQQCLSTKRHLLWTWRTKD